MKSKDSILFQNPKTIGEDKSSEAAKYRLSTYGADFTLEVLNVKLHSNEIVVPPFQRMYVWSPKRASRLIESFLLGLPVPQVFLYREEKYQDLLVVDGQQRLKTVQFFFDEKFENGSKFYLRDVKSKWKGKTFTKLDDRDKRFFKNSVLRATIFEQTDPKDNTSMFEIFNRLNTGGMALSSQEIRNCLYRGKIKEFLDRLNRYEKWRLLLGTPQPDKRMRDIELILRFFALMEDWKNYKKSMRDFVSSYMDSNRDMDERKQDTYFGIFKKIIDKIHDDIGSKAFRVRGGVNAAVLDSIMVALSEIGPDKVKNLKEKYGTLLENKDYVEYISKWTTDTDRVTGRIKIAIGTFS